MKNRKVKTIITAAALASCLLIGGISAYFTDGDTATNTFTVGKISIDLQEPSWNPPTDITPEQVIAKDPQVKNDGINDAYVFVEVTVPYANVVTANEDGTKNAAADTDLFILLDKDGNEGVNEGWVQVGTANKDTAAKTVTYLYAYSDGTAMTALSKDATTENVFDSVKFANIVEDQNLEETTQHVVVNAYAIQTTDINDSDPTGTDKTAPADVWAVLSAQVPTTDVAAEEDATTDIKK